MEYVNNITMKLFNKYQIAVGIENQRHTLIIQLVAVMLAQLYDINMNGFIKPKEQILKAFSNTSVNVAHLIRMGTSHGTLILFFTVDIH